MPTVTISGREYDIPTDLTLGELRRVKQSFGASLLGGVFDTSDPAVLASLAWISMHRVDPSITPAAVDELHLSAFEAVDTSDSDADTFESTDPADPTQP